MMAHSNHAAEMPDWPARLNAHLTALYLGIGVGSLYDGIKTGRYPAPLREGGRVFWARQQLDEFVKAQFGLETATERKNTWD